MTEDDSTYSTFEAIRGIDEGTLRVEALRLASHSFGHQGAEVVVAAAEEYLDFLLDDLDDEDEDYDIDRAPNGEPILVKFFLSEEAVVYLGVLVATAIEVGRNAGVPDDNGVSAFGLDVLCEINDTLAVINEGALV